MSAIFSLISGVLAFFYPKKVESGYNFVAQKLERFSKEKAEFPKDELTRQVKVEPKEILSDEYEDNGFGFPVKKQKAADQIEWEQMGYSFEDKDSE